MATQLLVVTLLFCSKPQFSALSHVIDAVSVYVDASVQLSLAKASKFGSLTLLNRIWDCQLDLEPKADTSWSLRSLLRSEPLYQSFQANAALVEAVKRRDMLMIQWLFEHFPDFWVREDAVEEAAAIGDMDILRFFLERDVDAAGTDVTDDLDLYHVICWGNLDMARAAAEGHAEVVDWLQTTEEHNFRNHSATIMAAIANGNLQLVQLVERMTRIPVTQCIVAAAGCGHLHLVEWLHDRIPDASPAGLLLEAAENGHLDIVRWIIERDWNNEDLDSNSDDDDPYRWGGYAWDRDSYDSQKRGHVTSVGGEASLAIHAAAINGHLEVAKYLHARVDTPIDREDESRESQRLSATRKALKDHFGDKSETMQTVSQTTTLIAAKKGLFDVVKWLYSEFHVNPTIDIWGGLGIPY